MYVVQSPSHPVRPSDSKRLLVNYRYESKDMNQTQNNTEWVQLPVRIDKHLSEVLDRISRVTRIPKSEIARTSIRRTIADLERTGVRSALEQLHSV